MKHFSTRDLVRIGLFTALMVVFAQIAIPLPISPVPLTLSTFAIFLSSSLLPPQSAIMVQILYILLGLIGFPVFAGFKSGVPVLFGPTGGYIVSYLFMAPVISILSSSLSKQAVLKKTARISLPYAFSYIVSMILCYLFGSVWLMFYIGTPFSNVLALAVAPYLLADSLKIILCAAIAPSLKKVLYANPHINM